MQNGLKLFGEKDIGLLSGRFSTARAKLTFMYVAILAILLTLSSSSIYSAFSSRLERRFERFRPRAPLILPEGIIPPSSDELRADLMYSLFLVNGILLFAGGAFSYFLAGITLAPIQQAYERQQRFLGDASHELRTPLAILQTDLENELHRSDLAPQAREQRQSNLEEVHHMSRLVSDVLALSRSDESEMPNLGLIKVDVVAFVRSLVKSLQSVAEAKLVQLAIESSSVESAYVFANEDMLLQTLRNLIQNAIIYNVPQGQVQISIATEAKRVRITIVDTGIGISASDLDQIFERFYRVDKSRSRQTGGSGLGLSIVRAHLERMKGTLEIQSELGKGTRITVFLPLESAS